MKKRNEAIDAVKGFAILIVMLGHVLVLNDLEDPYLYNMIKVLQMPLFMCVSGYTNGLGKKIVTLQDFTAKIARRAVSLLLPFFSWIVLLHITDIPGAVVRTLFQLERGLWFLMTLFILTCMVSIAEFAKYHDDQWGIKKAELVFAGVFGLQCLLLLFYYLKGFTFLSPGLTVYYLPFYFFGYLTAGHKLPVFYPEKENKGEQVLWKFLYILSGTGFVVMIITHDFLLVETRSSLLLQMLTAGLGCIFFSGVFLCMRDNKVRRILSFLGKYTLEIYVLHFHFATLLNSNKETGTLYSVNGILFVLAAFALMSVITGLLIFIIKRVKILDLLLFGKKPGVSI